jgi:hypothetical protein
MLKNLIVFCLKTAEGSISSRQNNDVFANASAKVIQFHETDKFFQAFYSHKATKPTDN